MSPPFEAETDDYTDEEEEFLQRDMVTGKKTMNPLNRKHLTKYELDELFAP